MPLPTPEPRKPSHQRLLQFQAYEREDGLWDIDASLTDTKSYDFQIPGDAIRPAGQAIHGLHIRLTVNDQMQIIDIATAMDDIPHAECAGAPFGMHKLIGEQLGSGWRQTIAKHIGGVQGCTHLRELLFNMATVAYQTIPAARIQAILQRGEMLPPLTSPPPHLGQCHSWALDGTVLARNYPQFYRSSDPDENRPS